MRLPDLSEYRLQRRVEPAEFEGTAVPGLSAEFYHRADGERTASVGRYRYHGRELLMAWGFVDEDHCRFNAVRDPDGGWSRVRPGCPDVVIHRDGGWVVGIEVRPPDGR